MDIRFDFDLWRCIHNVRFEGLDGTEPVTSVKDALGRMKIRNIATTFSENVQASKYEGLSDDEYERMLEHVKFLSGLWRYPDAPRGAPQEYEMNALMLLANALELLCK